MGCKKGDRVGAVLSASNGEVHLLGFGVYEGNEVPHGMNVGTLGVMARAGIPNPKIKLDSGAVVWGCECWWGSEAGLKRELESGRFAGMKVVEVDAFKIRSGQSSCSSDMDDGVQSL